MGPTSAGRKQGKRAAKGPVLITPISNQYAALDFDDKDLSLPSVDITLDFGQDNADTVQNIDDNLSDFDALSVNSAMSTTASQFLAALTNCEKYDYPNLSDVHHERIKVGNELAKHTQFNSNTSLAYIINSKDTQRLQLGLKAWSNFTRYTTPNQPGIPTTKQEALAFKIKMNVYIYNWDR